MRKLKWIVIVMAAPLFIALPCSCTSCFPDADRHARETAALVAIRTIDVAEEQYHSQFSRYASLAELGLAVSR